MMTNEQKKCAHLPCRCVTQNGDKYCGQACKEAGSSEVERLPHENGLSSVEAGSYIG